MQYMKALDLTLDLKAKRVLPSIELYDKYQLFDFVVRGQGHSKLTFVLDTPPCIVHTYIHVCNN